MSLLSEVEANTIHLLEKYSSSVNEIENIQSKLQKIMINFQIKPDNLDLYIESALFNSKDNEKNLTMKHLDTIEKQLIQIGTKIKPDPKSSGKKVIFEDQSSTKIESKTLEIESTYNEDLHCQVKMRFKQKKREITIEPQEKFHIFKDFIKAPLNGRTKALISRFECLKSIFSEYLTKKSADFLGFQDFTAVPNQKVFSFVRIICEDEGRLNEKSILLDFPDLSFPVHLDISEIENVMLYSGQMIAIEGIYEENHDYRRFIAQTIIANPFDKLDFESENFNERKKATKIPAELNATVIFAAGPYTSDEDLSFTQLYELLNQIKILEPEIVVLYGPFLPKEHKVIKSGVLEFKGEFLSYDSLLNSLFYSISDQLSNNGIKTYIVPDVDDINNVFPIPQEPFNKILSTKNVFLLSNPNNLVINDELIFSLFNCKIIDEFRGISLYKMPASQNRIDPILAQFAAQLNLNPIFPCSYPIDISKINYLDIKQGEMPNFVVIPSKLGGGFARLNGEILFVNPGFVIDRRFAVLTIYEDSEIRVENRTRVDIVKF